MKRIAVLALVFMIGLIFACSSGPQYRTEWSKPGWTQQEWAKDKYECMQEAQQQRSHAMGGFCSGYVCVPGRSDSTVVTNWTLFNACLEARGWSSRLVK